MGMTIDGAAAFIDDGKSIASLNAILEPSPIRAIITPTQKECDIESPKTIPTRAAADPIAAMAKYAHQWNCSAVCVRNEYNNS